MSTALDNVTLPCQFSQQRKQQAIMRHGSIQSTAQALLESLGLAGPLHEQLAGKLSIGQQPRVAAARALIGQPKLVIADEPTSALDTDSRAAFLHLLFTECQAAGASLLFVNHDQSLSHFFDLSLDLNHINRAASALEIYSAFISYYFTQFSQSTLYCTTDCFHHCPIYYFITSSRTSTHRNTR